MSDDQTPVQDPKATQDPAPESKSLQERLGEWLGHAYETNKLVFFTAGIVLGALYLAIKYHQLLIDLLLGSAKELNKEALAKDAALKTQADKTKSEGDAMVAKANNEGKDNPPVNDDWFKK